MIVTMAAMGGSIMASGAVLGMEKVDKLDKIHAASILEGAKRMYKEAQHFDKVLREIGPLLSNDEFEAQLAAVRRLRATSLDDLHNARVRTERLGLHSEVFE